MVTRRRLRTVLHTLALYCIVALVIAYFGVNAYSGNRGLVASQDLERRIVQLTDEKTGLVRERERWEQRVRLLKPESIDPDLLDELARSHLGYTGSNDLVMPLPAP
jgi:cell division protein FtsB